MEARPRSVSRDGHLIVPEGDRWAIGLQSAKKPDNKCKTCRVGTKGRWVGVGGGVGGLADRALKQGGLADRAKNGIPAPQASETAQAVPRTARKPPHNQRKRFTLHNSIIEGCEISQARDPVQFDTIYSTSY